MSSSPDTSIEGGRKPSRFDSKLALRVALVVAGSLLLVLSLVFPLILVQEEAIEATASGLVRSRDFQRWKTRGRSSSRLSRLRRFRLSLLLRGVAGLQRSKGGNFGPASGRSRLPPPSPRPTGDAFQRVPRRESRPRRKPSGSRLQPFHGPVPRMDRTTRRLQSLERCVHNADRVSRSESNLCHRPGWGNRTIRDGNRAARPVFSEAPAYGAPHGTGLSLSEGVVTASRPPLGLGHFTMPMATEMRLYRFRIVTSVTPATSATSFWVHGLAERIAAM